MSAIRSRVSLVDRIALPATGAGVDLRGPVTWLIAAGAVVYLGLNGGGYDTTIWGGVGVIAWWAVVLVALVALDLVRKPSRLGLVAIGALGGLVVWSAIGMIWSSSDERTLNEVGRVSTYLGFLVIAIAATRRGNARQLASGLATGIAVVSVLALLSRLRPTWFPASANETTALLPEARNRLSYPLDYWNALGALVALGIPLLVSFAAEARAWWRRALAAAALPPLVLTLILTLSRGALLALAVALITYFIIGPRRVQALLTAGIAAVGAAIASAVALNDHDLRQGLNTGLAHRQGTTVLIVLVVVSAGVAAAQLGLTVVATRESPHRFRRSRPFRPWPVVGGLLLIGIVTFLVFGGPHAVSKAWTSFKRPQLSHNAGPNRLKSISANGRYQYWRASIKAMEHRPLTGVGAGTWEFWWTRHGRDASYALNAHSLLFESLAEDGVPGGVLVVVFLATIIAATVRCAWRAPGSERAPFAAVAAACAAGTLSLAADWNWQVALVPLCMVALAGLALGSGDNRVLAPSPWRMSAVAMRLGVIVLALAALASITIPLATTSEIRQSQSAFNRGALGEALQDARAAASLEPYGATPWLQQALVLESSGHLAAAEAAASRAQQNESANWREPLILARIQAERGETEASLASAQRALTLNPSIRQYLP